MDHETFEETAIERVGEVLPPLARDISPMVAAEINQQIATARRFPRRQDSEIINEIKARACLDIETASECLYTLNRGGKKITGPSVRFAEITAASYGNLRTAARFVEIDIKEISRAAVVIEGVCLDLQNNNATLSPVRRSIVTSTGKLYNADMTNMAFVAGSAIARRNAILQTVPKMLWSPGIKRVVSALQGDVATLSQRREEILEAFSKRDIKPMDVFAAIGVKGVADIGAEHMPELFGMLNALAEGETPESVLGRRIGGGGDESDARYRNNPLKDDDEPEQGKPQPRQEARTEAKQGPEATKGQPEPEKKPAPAETKPEAKKEAPKPANADQPPATEAEYAEYARAWFPNMRTAADAEKRWKEEKTLRRACKVSGDVMEALREELDRTDFEG